MVNYFTLSWVTYPVTVSLLKVKIQVLIFSTLAAVHDLIQLCVLERSLPVLRLQHLMQKSGKYWSSTIGTCLCYRPVLFMHSLWQSGSECNLIPGFKWFPWRLLCKKFVYNLCCCKHWSCTQVLQILPAAVNCGFKTTDSHMPGDLLCSVHAETDMSCLWGQVRKRIQPNLLQFSTSQVRHFNDGPMELCQQ